MQRPNQSENDGTDHFLRLDDWRKYKLQIGNPMSEPSSFLDDHITMTDSEPRTGVFIDPRLKRHELGFLEVADKPTPEQLQTYYANLYFQNEQANYRKSYPEDELRFFRAKIAQKAAVVSSLRGFNRTGTMLDVGCGEGFALAWFQEHGWQVEGIDYSISGVNAMNPKMQSLVRTGDVFCLLQERIDAGLRYDIVWLTNVLEHVLQPIELLKSLRRVVAADGVLVVTVPNDGSSYQQQLYEHGDISERFWIAIPDHLAYFTHESLSRTAEATGWACPTIIGDFPIDWFLMHSASNYVRDRSKGPDAHKARVRMELLLSQLPCDQVNDFYRAMAAVGMGRGLTAFLTPK